MFSELISVSKWNHMWTTVSEFWENVFGIRVIFVWLFQAHRSRAVIHVFSETVEGEAYASWGCTGWDGWLAISYSSSDVNLHNKPAMLVVLSPFYKWNRGLDRWWNAPKGPQLVSGGAGLQRTQSLSSLYVALASLTMWQPAESEFKSLFYLYLYRDCNYYCFFY